MNEEAQTNGQTPTWVVNEHGVKSCWPFESAREMVMKNYGWAFAEADDVAEQKQYPIGIGELTPTGLQRRKAAQSTTKQPSVETESEETAVAPESDIDALRKEAKRLGVPRYYVKSATRLEKEIAELSS